MVGAMLQAAERRMVLLIDGFIVTSALLVAARVAAGDSRLLRVLALLGRKRPQAHARPIWTREPLLQLDLRLGEGTGCGAGLPLLHAAVNFLREMATFESAQVSEKSA